MIAFFVDPILQLFKYDQLNGNIFDVGSIALKAALLTTVLPNVVKDDQNDEQIGLKLPEKTQLHKLSLPSFPLLVTLFKTRSEFFIDADHKEESVIITRLVFAIDDEGSIKFLRKHGPGAIHPEGLSQAMEIAKPIGIKLHKKVNSLLLHDLDPLAAFDRQIVEEKDEEK